MANIQILFAALFALNLLLLWMVTFIKSGYWYRLVGYPLIVVLPLLTVFFEQPHFELDYYWWVWAGFASILIGLALAGWAMLELNKEGNRWRDYYPERLVTAGPYHFVRHPLYLSLIFMWVGWWWAFAAVYSFYFGMLILMLLWLHARLEEKLILEKRFGHHYESYRQKTGMFWVK